VKEREENQWNRWPDESKAHRIQPSETSHPPTKDLSAHRHAITTHQSLCEGQMYVIRWNSTQDCRKSTIGQKPAISASVNLHHDDSFPQLAFELTFIPGYSVPHDASVGRLRGSAATTSRATISSKIRRPARLTCQARNR